MVSSKNRENFSKSIGYLFISQVLVKMLGLLYSLYLINKPKFGDEGNALYLSGYQIFAFMLTFSAIGVPNAVSNMIAKSNDYSSLNKVFKTAIYVYVFFASCSSLILFSFSKIISNKFIGFESVSYNLKLLSPIIIVSTLESIYIGFFNGIKQMKVTAKVQFAEQLFKTIFTISIVEILSKYTDNAMILSIGATLGVACSTILSLIMYFFEKRKIRVYAKKFYKSEISSKHIIIDLLKFSVPISIGAMLVGINRNIDSFSIMNLLSNNIGKESAQKIYGIIASKVDVLILFPLSFNITFSTALIPNIAEARKNNDSKSIIELVHSSICMSLVIGIISTLGLYFFSENIFYLLFSNSSDGQELLKLASFSVFFSILNQTFSGILQALQKNKIPVMASFIGTIIKVVLNLIFINLSCLLEKGIILSTIISNAFMFIILYKAIKKNIKIHFKRYIILIFVASIIMIAICIITNNLFILIGIKRKLGFVLSILVGGFAFLMEYICICNFLGINFINKIKK